MGDRWGSGKIRTYARRTRDLPVHSCELRTADIALYFFLVVLADTNEGVDGERGGEAWPSPERVLAGSDAHIWSRGVDPWLDSMRETMERA